MNRKIRKYGELLLLRVKTDNFPADVLRINGTECFDLKTNNEIIEYALFLHNIIEN